MQHTFSSVGVEKNNDDAWRNYFSSNRWDACGDMLRTEIRLEKLSSTCQRKKRKYEKHDTEYWSHKKTEECQAKRACIYNT